MSAPQVENINVAGQEILLPPQQLKQELPASAKLHRFVSDARQTLCNILDRKDPRLFLVVGPCSVHNPEQALEYAGRLKQLATEVEDVLFLVMRVYFEKPRTSTGWKGMINDPGMDDSFRVEDGLRNARKLLLDINGMGLPVATEALDPIVPQYLHELISWSVIGARTTESQTHRELASGLSSPVGFKNSTTGQLDAAINSLLSALRPHHFLGIDEHGRTVVVHTRGNSYVQVVLRGSAQGPNYDSAHIRQCEQALQKIEVRPNIVVDCSHANSNKQYALQPLVLDSVIDQVCAGNTSIIGAMLESNLEEGRQDIPEDLRELRYGVSVTDACIGWETTRECILGVRQKLLGAPGRRAVA